MSDYYHQHYQTYYEKTFPVDPSSFLTPLAAHLKPGSTILDVGCGSGRDMLWLKGHGYNVSGLERSGGLARLARKHSACRVIEADFETYDFSQMAVEALVLVGAMVHLPRPGFPMVLKSICRALKKAGILLITLKQGNGAETDPHGRKFSLWQDTELRDVFHSQSLIVIDFFRQPSKINTDDIWLGYVLKKTSSKTIKSP
jgi:SAM-dependent methyltransferase